MQNRRMSIGQRQTDGHMGIATRRGVQGTNRGTVRTKTRRIPRALRLGNAMCKCKHVDVDCVSQWSSDGRGELSLHGWLEWDGDGQQVKSSKVG